MAVRGRKPKPTSMKVIEGNPGRRPLPEDEPTPPLGPIPAPDYLEGPAKEAWDYLAPMMVSSGIVARVDRDALVRYCESWGRVRDLTKEVDDSPAVIQTKTTVKVNPIHQALRAEVALNNQLAAELGITPSSRSRVSKSEPPAPVAHQRFFGGGQ